MTSTDPLHVSPYLTLPCRDVRTACMALIRHADHRPPCGACEIADLCLCSSDRVCRVSHRNSPDTLPKAALNLPAQTRPARDPSDVAA